MERERHSGALPTRIDVGFFATKASLVLSNTSPPPPSCKQLHLPESEEIVSNTPDAKGRVTTSPRERKQIVFFDDFGCLESHGFAIGFSFLKHFAQPRPPEFKLGMRAFRYRNQHYSFLETRYHVEFWYCIPCPLSHPPQKLCRPV